MVLVSHKLYTIHRTVNTNDVSFWACSRPTTPPRWEACIRHCQVNEKSLPDAFPLKKAEGVGIAKIQGLVQAQNPL